MATPWKRGVRKAGKITVKNDADNWKPVVESAIKTFNAVGLGVTLESVAGDDADIVVKLSDGTGKHTFNDRYYGEVPVTAVFDASAVHGKTKTLVDPDKNVIVKAVIFLPKKLKDVTAPIKEAVVVHEFIHAAGLDDNKDHDRTAGIFYSPLEYSSGRLVEWGTGGKAKSMPPIRVGNETSCKLKALWIDSFACD